MRADVCFGSVNSDGLARLKSGPVYLAADTVVAIEHREQDRFPLHLVDVIVPAIGLLRSNLLRLGELFGC